MRKSIKAVLLSALVLPGLGHFSLKKPIQGSVLVGISLFCIYLVVSKVIAISQGLAAKIESGEIPYDVAKISELVTEKLSDGENQSIAIATLVIIICWIVAVVDSFRVGRQQDKMA